MKYFLPIIGVLLVIKLSYLNENLTNQSIKQIFKNNKVSENFEEYLIEREVNEIKYINFEEKKTSKLLMNHFFSKWGYKNKIYFNPQQKIRAYFNDSKKKDNLKFYIKRALDRVFYVKNPKILIASYEISNHEIVNHLIKLKKTLKNLIIRIVVEWDVIKKSKEKMLIINKLKLAGIEVISDKKVRGNALMHHKFIIINDECLITGSTNFSNRGFNKNANHLIEIFSAKVCKLYTKEFNRLWAYKFSKNKKLEGSIKKIDEELSIGFAPSNKIVKNIFKEISKAKQSINMSMFFLSSIPILEMLKVMKKKGINIKLKLDNMCLGAKVKISKEKLTLKKFLQKNKIEFISDESRFMYHHKYIIVDANTTEAFIICGSMNFTKSGFHRNDENYLIIRNKKVVSKFIDNFNIKDKDYVKEIKIDWPKFDSVKKINNKLILTIRNNNNFELKIKDNKRWIKSYINYGNKLTFTIKNVRKSHYLKLYSQNNLYFDQIKINTNHKDSLNIPINDCAYSKVKYKYWYPCLNTI